LDRRKAGTYKHGNAFRHTVPSLGRANPTKNPLSCPSCPSMFNKAKHGWTGWTGFGELQKLPLDAILIGAKI
jgi:hypothetical protein